MKHIIFIFISLSVMLYFKNLNATENNALPSEEKTMKLIIQNQSFTITPDQNPTTKDILKNLPFSLEMVEYAGHEFYASLPFTPTSDKNQTSHLLAGHIYYWDGWNSFVINYKEYDIAPFKSVHIGEIDDKSILKILEKSKSVSIQMVE